MAKAKRSKEAPGALGLVQRFVNTRNPMRGYDLLDGTERATAWLEEAGYGPPDNIEEAELASLRELREGLRDILLRHNLGSSSETAGARPGFGDLVGATALGVGFDSSGRPFLTSSSAGAERIVGDLLIAAVAAGYEGTWPRLKACANEGCRWIFYDASKNRSGSWCVMEICGARHKMRRYRERKESEGR